MSCSLYLECRSHEPAISSYPQDVGYRESDDQIERAKGFIARRSILTRMAANPAEYPHDEYGPFASEWEGRAAVFLSEHPHCAVGLRTEYGADLTPEVG